MRVLMVHPGPEFSVVDVYRGWARGFAEMGCKVRCLDLGDRLTFYNEAQFLDERTGAIRRAVTHEQAAWLAARDILAAACEWWPDVVVIVSGFFVPRRIYEVLRARGRTVVLLHTESPYEDETQVIRAAAAEINVVNDPTNLDRFTAVAPTAYIPHAYDPAVHHPRPPAPDLVSDFAFVGTGFPSRVSLFEAVDWTGIDVALAGNWQMTAPDSPLRKFLAHDIAECFDNDDTAALYASTKASANIYRDAEGWAMGPREIELAACGTFYLTEPRPENRQVLGFLPTFDGPADFECKLRWWLAHDDAREAVAAKARAAVADRTFAANAAHLLRLLDRR